MVTLANKKEFQELLKNGLCPFCGDKLSYYDGALGYESQRCLKCAFECDLNGMHFRSEL
jgi:hypothetical protein